MSVAAEPTLAHIQESVLLLESLTIAIQESPTRTCAEGKLLELICDVTGWAVGEYWSLTADRSRLALLHSSSRDPGRCRSQASDDAAPLALCDLDHGIAAQIFQARSSRWGATPPAQEDPWHARLADADGLKQWLGVCLQAKGEVVGVLVFLTPQVADDDIHTVQLLAGVSRQLAYMLQRRRAEDSLEERARITALGAEVGIIVTKARALRDMLQQCSDAIVRHLGAAFARIWTLDPAGTELQLEASAGLYTHIDGAHARIKVGKFKIGRIAATRSPHLTNSVQTDPAVSDPEWAAREGMVAFAGYPLIVENRLLGVVAMFARQALSEFTLKALGSLTDAIALGIERMRTHETLLLQQARLDIVQQAGRIGTFDWCIPSGDVVWSEQLETLYGLPAGGFGGRYEAWRRQVHPEDIAQLETEIADAIRDRMAIDTEFRAVRSDGSVCWINMQARTIYDAVGAPQRMAGINMDVTQQKEAEQVLRLRALQQEAVADLSQRALIWNDLSFLMQEAVATVATTLDVERCGILELVSDDQELSLREGVGLRESSIGQTRIPVAGSPFSGVLERDAPELVDDVAADPRFACLGEHLQGTAGSAISVLIPGVGKPYGVLTVLTRCGRRFSSDDLSFLKAVAYVVANAIHRHQSDEERFLLSSAIAQATESVLVTRPDGGIVYVNPAFERIFGFSRAEAVGSTPRLLRSGTHDDAFYRGIWQTVASGQTWSGEIVNRRKDGSLLTQLLTITPLRNQQGDVSHFIAVGVDVTERKRLEAQLAQSQKLESIGQLAAGIAHEINTPTQYVGDNLHFLGSAFRDLEGVIRAQDAFFRAARDQGGLSPAGAAVDQAYAKSDLEYLLSEIPKAVTQTLEGVDSVARIVRAMKEFSHPGGEEMAPADINQAILSTATVARNEWKYVAELVTDLDPNLPAVPCLIGEVKQVLLNLIVNAAHAIADVVERDPARKGAITISTRAVGLGVEIRVADTGTGIPERHRQRIFDPFFTTKAVGKGTGQGLTIAHTVVVKKHRGSLDFETEEGKGTTFIVRLPAASEQPCPEGSLATP